MKLVIIDGHIINPGDVSWAGFEKLGELSVWNNESEPDAATIIQELQGAQAAMMRQTAVRREVLEACPELKFITLTSTGYDQLSPELLRYARERGITICNIPSYGTPAVAQHAFALLLELCNLVGKHDRAIREGRWGRTGDFCFWDGTLMELNGKTLGVVGLGAIGQAVARIARGFGMHVLAYSPHVRQEYAELVEFVEIEQLYHRSDVISLHCPLKRENREMICEASIAQMKDGAILINTARGGLLREADVAKALASGKLGGVGVDVVSQEPIQEDNPLLHAPNCIITPHLAWVPKETRQRLIDFAIENLRAYLAGEPVHVINP